METSPLFLCHLLAWANQPGTVSCMDTQPTPQEDTQPQQTGADDSLVVSEEDWQVLSALAQAQPEETAAALQRLAAAYAASVHDVQVLSFAMNTMWMLLDKLTGQLKAAHEVNALAILTKLLQELKMLEPGESLGGAQ